MTSRPGINVGAFLLISAFLIFAGIQGIYWADRLLFYPYSIKSDRFAAESRRKKPEITPIFPHKNYLNISFSGSRKKFRKANFCGMTILPGPALFHICNCKPLNPKMDI